MHFNVLDRHLRVSQSHCLEASAGTGKTFAIEHLVTRLIIEGETPLLIEEILVVTFTRAATRELKKRIYRNLKAIKEELLKKSSPIDYVQALVEQGESLRALERIEAALICYDRAPIYTLHGCCYRLLKEFAFEAQLNMEISDPDKRESAKVLQGLVKEYLKKEVVEPQYSPYQIQLLLRKARRQPLQWISMLTRAVDNNKTIAQQPTHQELLEAFRAQLQQLPLLDLLHFKADLAHHLPRYLKMTSDKIPSQIEFFSLLLSSRVCLFLQFEWLLKQELFLEGMGEENLKKRVKPLDLSLLHYPELIPTLRATLLPLIRKAKDPVSIQLRLASDLQKKTKPLLEEAAVFSPDTLLLKVKEALHSEAFISSVRKKFKAAIIDEFQDTDPLQWDIFKTLFPPQSNALLYLVGDPKQSIYAFRNADVFVYLQAAEEMGIKKHLTTNFRSTPSLVEGLNRLFSKAKKAFHPIPDAPALQAGSTLPPLDDLAPIQCWMMSCKQLRSKKFPPSSCLEEKVLPHLASEIIYLHKEKKVAYHEIAVLVKDRYQAQTVIDYLKRSQIPASAQRGSPITESVAYFDLKEVLRALYSPQSRGKLKAALGTTLIGLTMEQFQEEVLLFAKAQVGYLHSLLFKEGFGVFFQAFLQTVWTPGGSPLLQHLHHEMYADLRQLCTLVIEETQTHAFDPLDYLEQLALQQSSEDPRLQSHSQEEKGSVTIMTIHRSKGLEFEVVFALGISSRQPAHDLVTIKTPSGPQLLPLDKEDPAHLRALEEENQEKLRQLYVSLTRAKRKLYIPCIFEEKAQSIEPFSASPLEIFFSKMGIDSLSMEGVQSQLEELHPFVQMRVLENAEPPCNSLEAAPVELLPSQPLLNISLRPAPVSFTSLAVQHLVVETKKPQKDAPLSVHTLPLGSETGVFLHSLFETLLKKGLHNPLDIKRIEACIVKQVMGSSWEPWLSVLTPWVVDLFKRPLLHFSLSDIPQTQQLTEIEFLYPCALGMVKGFADLAFVFEGKYYLLDWKSNYLGPSDADYTQKALKGVMEQHDYALQASLYKEALKRYVKLFDNRPFESCFGGALYYFVRGRAIYHLELHDSVHDKK
jgi:exodeoxyribonuclease V beta subunit